MFTAMDGQIDAEYLAALHYARCTTDPRKLSAVLALIKRRRQDTLAAARASILNRMRGHQRQEIDQAKANLGPPTRRDNG